MAAAAFAPRRSAAAEPPRAFRREDARRRRGSARPAGRLRAVLVGRGKNWVNPTSRARVTSFPSGQRPRAAGTRTHGAYICQSRRVSRRARAETRRAETGCTTRAARDDACPRDPTRECEIRKEPRSERDAFRETGGDVFFPLDRVSRVVRPPSVFEECKRCLI